MKLTSHRMALSSQEKRWLPWMGSSEKLAMRLACFYNQDRYQALENVLENFTWRRVKILQQWAAQQWQQRKGIALRLSVCDSTQLPAELARQLDSLSDFTELFILWPDKQVQHQAAEAVESMQSDTSHLEQGLQLAEVSTGENIEIQHIVHSLLDPIKQLPHSGLEHASATAEIGTVTATMHLAQQSRSDCGITPATPSACWTT